MYRLGRTEAADAEAGAVAEACRRGYGGEHPVTLSAQTLYARTRASLGDLTLATDTMDEVVGRRERILGADHPYTVRTLKYLDEFSMI